MVSESIRKRLEALIKEVVGHHDEAAAGGPLGELREVVNSIPEQERESTLREAAGRYFDQLSLVFLA